MAVSVHIAGRRPPGGGETHTLPTPSIIKMPWSAWMLLIGPMLPLNGPSITTTRSPSARHSRFGVPAHAHRASTSHGFSTDTSPRIRWIPTVPQWLIMSLANISLPKRFVRLDRPRRSGSAIAPMWLRFGASGPIVHTSRRSRFACRFCSRISSPRSPFMLLTLPFSASVSARFLSFSRRTACFSACAVRRASFSMAGNQSQQLLGGGRVSCAGCWYEHGWTRSTVGGGRFLQLSASVSARAARHDFFGRSWVCS